MMTHLRVLLFALAATLVAVGCGGGSGAGHVDAGRDAAATADAADSRGDEAPRADSGSDGASPSGSDARMGGSDAADVQPETSAADAPGDPQTDLVGLDAPPDLPVAADAPPDVDDAQPVDVVPWAPRDAAYELAPPHDTRPTYRGSFSAVTMGDSTFVAVAPDGATYVAGSFRQPTDFDPGPGQDMHTPLGQEDAYVTKLGADGSYAWTLTFGGAGSQTFSTALAVSGTALVIAGVYSDEVDFDPGPGEQNRFTSANNQYAGFVLTLSREGAFRWVSTFVGQSACTPKALALDDDGSIYGAGAIDGDCDFDPGPGEDVRSNTGVETAFLLKLGGADGHEVWTKTSAGGGSCNGSLTAVTISSDGLVWATGQMTAGCSFAGRDTPVEAGDHGAAIVAITPTGMGTGLWTIAGGDGMAIVGSPDGFVYVGGYVAGLTSVDFDPGPFMDTRSVSPGDGDPTGFVLKLGPGAAYRWVQLTPRIQTYGLAATDDGGVIVIAQPVPDTNQTVAYVVTKRDPDSSSPWGIMFPGTNAGAFSIAAGRSMFVLAGEAGGLFDLDPGPAFDSISANTAFVSRFSY
jgi:hypothetical protein